MNTEKNIIRLISAGRSLKLKASDGSRLIYQATDVFNSYIDASCVNLGINSPGIATPDVFTQVHEIIANSTFMDIFQALPGGYNEKWLPQDKVVDFCRTFPHWLRQVGGATFFPIKENENEPIDEGNPADNLAIGRVYVCPDGLGVLVGRLRRGLRWGGDYRHRIIVPEFTP